MNHMKKYNLKKSNLQFIELKVIDDHFLLKVKLKKGLLLRIYFNPNLPKIKSWVDLIDLQNNTIIYKHKKQFFEGMGIGILLADLHIITHWEIMGFDIILRSIIFFDLLLLEKSSEKFNIFVDDSISQILKFGF